ncbi:hypothetical protein LB503_000968 [Fusarium chuoi]|nr:hypothetical protein LB503_000968 [Fusarium chuoi]
MLALEGLCTFGIHSHASAVDGEGGPQACVSKWQGRDCCLMWYLFIQLPDNGVESSYYRQLALPGKLCWSFKIQDQLLLSRASFKQTNNMN